MMNYQTSALWFYQARWLAITAVSLLFTAAGFSAGLGYLLLAGLFYPVLISLYIHRLRETGKAFCLEKNSNWLVYVNGIPVREKRKILSNPCFTSVDRTRRFFMHTFLLKLAMQIACIGILLSQVFSAPVTTLNAVIASIIILALLYPLRHTLLALFSLRTEKLQFETIIAQNGSVGFQGFFAGTPSRTSALDVLLSIK